jgi:hypothetical protein
MGESRNALSSELVGGPCGYCPLSGTVSQLSIGRPELRLIAIDQHDVIAASANKMNGAVVAGRVALARDFPAAFPACSPREQE